ncbi:hypothetical protein BKI52_23385 [marine bacterium AO1-C]|nr:hypothetical protein BKI52_23385 [marine bacterium AO1-C]
MSHNELSRYESQDLPTFFWQLNEEEQEKYLQQMTRDELEARKNALEKVQQSKIAEHDLAVVQGNIEAMDTSKKYYEIYQKVKTGSGEVEIKVQGGDPRFIVPLVGAASLVLMGLLYFLL